MRDSGRQSMISRSLIAAVFAFALLITGCPSSDGGDPGGTTGPLPPPPPPPAPPPAPVTGGKYVLWTRDSRFLPMNTLDMSNARSLGQISLAMASAPACDAGGAVTVAAPTSGTSSVEVDAPQFGSTVYTLNPTSTCTPMEVVYSPAELRIFTSGNGSGRVRSASGAIDCTITNGVTSGSCSATRTLGTLFNLTATTGSGSSFGGYGSVCSGVGAGAICGVKTTQSLNTITVQFTQAASTVSGSLMSSPSSFELAVNRGSSARLSVTIQQSNVAAALAAGRLSIPEYSAPCSLPATSCVTLALDGIEYLSTTQARVWFKAIAGSNATTGIAFTRSYDVLFSPPFDGKQYNVSPTTVTVSVRVNAPQMYTITVQPTGAQAGSIQSTSPDAQVRCFHDAGTTGSYDGAGGKCVVSYVAGTTVTLTAIPGSSSSVFAGWGGVCTGQGTAPTCTVTLTSSQTVTATFSAASTGGGGTGGGGTGGGGTGGGGTGSVCSYVIQFTSPFSPGSLLDWRPHPWLTGLDYKISVEKTGSNGNYFYWVSFRNRYTSNAHISIAFKRTLPTDGTDRLDLGANGDTESSYYVLPVGVTPLYLLVTRVRFGVDDSSPYYCR